MRTVSGMMLVAAFALVLGCGKSDPPADTKATPSGDPAPPQGGPGTPPAPPAPAAAAWEMDPAKHTFTGPITGKLFGNSITIDVQAERDSIKFRALNKDGQALQAFEIHLSDPTKSMEGLSLVVKPDQPSGIEVPNVILFNPTAPAEPAKILDKGYSLTLNMGKREKGKVNGRVTLCIADEKQSFVAGSFTSEWLRSREEPAGTEDTPFVQGTITVAGIAEPTVEIGYVRMDPAEPIVSNVFGTGIGPSGVASRSEAYRPRYINLFPAAMKEPARYEFTRLEPGRYWVFAKTSGGPASWKWVNVAAGAQETVNFVLDPAMFGGLDITAPNSVEAVAIVPASEPGKPWPESLISTASSILELRFESAAIRKNDPTKPVIVNLPRLAPGKYEVWAGDLTATVDVKVNETAKVELKKK